MFWSIHLIERSKAPLDNVRSEQQMELNESAEFLTAAALRQIEARHKRALSAASLGSLYQMTAIIRSWLRDVMIVASGADELIINVDCTQSLKRIGSTVDLAALMEVLREAYKTDEAIAYNVSPQTCLDALLFTIRKVVYGSGSTH